MLKQGIVGFESHSISMEDDVTLICEQHCQKSVQIQTAADTGDIFILIPWIIWLILILHDALFQPLCVSIAPV